MIPIEMIFRRLTQAEIPSADRLRQLAGWNQTPEDWSRLLRLSEGGCFVAVEAGEVVVGTVTTTPYGQSLAWIGMMLVHPERRRQGIGTRLMQLALAHLRERAVACIKLDATPAGRPLYAGLGFAPECALTRWQRTAGASKPAEQTPASVTECRDLASPDWPAIEAIDAAAFGANRADLLHALQADSCASLVWPSTGPPVGWGLLRPGSNADYLGPVICQSPEAMWPLVSALVSKAGPRSIIWDIHDENETARRAAQELGFTPARPLTRMWLGERCCFQDAQTQLALADPATG